MLSLWALSEAAISSMPDRLTSRLTSTGATIQGAFDVATPRLTLNPNLQQVFAAEFYLGALRLPFVPPVEPESTIKFARPRFFGSGSLRVNVRAKFTIQAMFSGEGGIHPNPNVRTNWTGQARFAGAGDFSSNPRTPVRWVAEARFAGSGSLSSLPTKRTNWVTEVRFAGSGNFSSFPRIPRQRAEARFAGSGSMSVDAQILDLTFLWVQAVIANGGTVSEEREELVRSLIQELQ